MAGPRIRPEKLQEIAFTKAAETGKQPIVF
jgi:hypothetical protein